MTNWWKTAVNDEVLSLRSNPEAEQRTREFMDRLCKMYGVQQVDRNYLLVNNEAVIDVRPMWGSIRISDIKALTPGSGAGRRTMSLLTALADQCGVALSGGVQPTGTGLSKRQLHAWYKRIGFTTGHHRDKDEIQRLPVPPQTKEAASKSLIPRGEAKTLAEVYGNEYPQGGELIWEYVGRSDYEKVKFKVVRINPVIWAASSKFDGLSMLAAFKRSAKPWQRELVQRYQGIAPTIANTTYLVVSQKEHKIIDGHHRIIALALAGIKAAKAIDLDQEIAPAMEDINAPAWPTQPPAAS